MIWYVQNVARWRSEQESLEALASKSDWLAPVGWRIDDSARLIWDVDIAAGGRTYEVSLRYPNHFPHSPPSVLPRSGDQRWSSHQYGAGGELCLEYGPDNWHPDITGADMIVSAHKLLGAEMSSPDERNAIPSRHLTTLGQDLRLSYGRLLVTRELAALAESLDKGTARAATVTILFHQESSTNVVTAVDLPGGQRWTEPAFQEDLLFEGYERDAVLVRWPENQPLPEADTRAGLVDEFKSAGLDLPQVNKIVLLQRSDFKGYSILEDNTVRILSVIPPQEVVPRVDDDHKKLFERKVSLVGCGSLGSKVAVMLARVGVGQFLLIDDDLLLPDNYVRHDLDWRDAGTHKVDSVARRLQLVNPAVRCEKRKHRLGGQEASGSIETLLEAIAKSDLIIDCTADASVFNYLSAAVAIGGKPLLWAEVFAGGIGGMIARSRPQIDPAPATMRLIIESWWHDRGQRRTIPAEDYGGTNELPTIADDSDVTLIAAHAARMGVDLLIPREPSAYPHSAYMIGLGRGGIFDGAFDTYPIDVGASAPGNEPKSLNAEEAAAQILKIATLLTEHRDAN